MTSQSIHLITNQANLIGRPRGVICKYEWDSAKRLFAWRFYRRGRWIGSTRQASKVVNMMTKYTTTQGENK